jgi:ribose transport system permease protein
MSVAETTSAGPGGGDLKKPGDREESRGMSLLGLVEAWTLPAITVVVILFFSFLPRTSGAFPTVANFQAVTGNQAILALVSIAVLFPLICGEFDLSVGAVVTLASVMSASVMQSGQPLAVAIVVALGVGVAAGLVNGLLVTRANLSAVIVTLGTSEIIAALVQAKTGGESIVHGISKKLISFGSGLTLGIPTIVIATLVIALFVYYVLTFTPFGRHLYMLGENRTAAKMVGLRDKRILLMSFVASGLVAGVAGLLQVGRLGSATPSTGLSLTLPAFAAAFLSASAIKPGYFNVGGTLAAILFLASLTAGLNLAGAAPWVAELVNGVALIVGVGLAVYIGRRRDPNRAI